MIKFCSDCGATSMVWPEHEGVEICRCGSYDLHPLDDQVIDIEFQSIMELTFTPLERYTLESAAFESMED